MLHGGVSVGNRSRCSVGRGDDGDRIDAKAEVEGHPAVFGIAVEAVEERGHGHRLPAPGVSDQGDPLQVDAAVEGVPRRGMPVAPELEVLQDQPRAGVVFTGHTPRPRAVQEALVQGHHQKAATRE